MINQFSLDASTNAMRVLSSTNGRLKPVKGSAIGVLNEAVNPRLLLDSSITDEAFFDGFQASTAAPRPAGEGSGYLNQGQGAVDILSIDDHEGTLHDLAATLAGTGEALLSFSRNTMQGMVSRILKNFNPTPEAAAVESWSIQPLQADPLLVDPLVATLLDALPDYARIPQTIEAVSEMAVPAGLACPATGSASYDSLVTRLLGELGMTPTQVMETIRQGDAASPLATKAFEIVKLRVLQLLLLAYYHENPWGDSGMDAVRWEYRTRDAMHQVIAWIKRYIVAMVTDADTSLLIRSYDPVKREVYILDAVLNDYLGRGGAVEAIYGLIYLREDGNSRIMGTVDSVIEHQPELLTAWDRHGVIRRQENRDDWRTINSRALKDAAQTAIFSEETTDADLALGEGRTRNSVAKACYETIDIYFRAAGESADLTEFVIRLVGDMSQEDNGAALLTHIHRAVAGGINPEQAATDWMVDFMLNGLLNEVDVEFQSA